MVLPDVNVLVYAHREDAGNHKVYREWLERLLNGDAAYGMLDWVLSGFIRVVTHPRVFKHPSKVSDALAFAAQLRDQLNCIHVEPGLRHWDVFRRERVIESPHPRAAAAAVGSQGRAPSQF